jgi:hypothetical protein
MLGPIAEITRALISPLSLSLLTSSGKAVQNSSVTAFLFSGLLKIICAILFSIVTSNGFRHNYIFIKKCLQIQSFKHKVNLKL